MKSMKAFTPTADRILVKLAERDTESPGGIILPPMGPHLPTHGKVIAVGPGRKNKKGARRPVEVNPGDVVHFYEGWGYGLDVEGAPHRLLEPEHVLAVENG